MQEKIRTYAALAVLLLGGGLVLFLFFRYVAGVLLPFLIGWGVALVVRRPALFLHRRTHLPEGTARLLLALFCAVAIASLLTLGARALVVELSVLANGLSGELPVVLDRVTEALSRVPFLGEWLSSSDTLSRLLSSVITHLPSAVSRLATALPSFFFALAVSVIAAVYFCLDLDRIHCALLRLFPARFHAMLSSAKHSALRTALSALRAEAVMMLLAFAVMLVGFLILGVPYPLLLSALFALLDFLPVIGAGTFLVPWAVWSLLSGARALGIGLLLLFAVIVLVRQLAEPHLLGKQVGMHPLLTLLSLYAGVRLFGAVGAILLPAVTMIGYGVFFAEEETQK